MLNGLFWRSLRRGASALALLAIALGVALGVAVSAIHRAALDGFEAGLRAVSGSADVEVVAADGLDEALYPRLARLPDVAAASPLVERELQVERGGRALTLRVVGLDPFRAAAVQPALLPPADGTGRFLQPGTLHLSPAAERALGASADDVLELRGHRFTVAGGLPAAGEGAVLAVLDIGEAQWRFGTPGRLQRIALKLADGVAREPALARIAAELPAGTRLQTPEQALQRADRLSRAYRVNLGLLALIALAVGSFLVAATQSAAIARRTREIAFLRTAGLTRRQLWGWLVSEGAVLGALGALAGIVIGHVMAALALRWVGSDLGAGLLAGAAPEWVFDGVASAGFGLLGILSAAAGAAWPARDALAIAPARALRAGVFSPPLRVLHPLRRAGVMLGLTVSGVCAALLPAWRGLPLGGYAAIACVLAVAVLAVPVLAGVCARRLTVPAAAHWQMARARLAAEPAFASRSAAGVLAACALIVAMAVMVSSFRASVDRWLGDVLPAERYVRGDRDAPWSPAQQAAMAAVPGIDRLVTYYYVDGRASGSLSPPDALPDGEYFLALYINDSYTEVSNRVEFTVGAGSTPEPQPRVLGVARTVVRAGDAIEVNWSGMPANAKDWIGVYRSTQTPGGNSPSVQWRYANGASGSAAFSGLAAGDYYVAFLLNDGYEEAAARVPFKVLRPGDINGDGAINVADRDAQRAALGSCEGDARYQSLADFDGDHCITQADYRLWYALFTKQ